MKIPIPYTAHGGSTSLEQIRNISGIIVQTTDEAKNTYNHTLSIEIDASMRALITAGNQIQWSSGKYRETMGASKPKRVGDHVIIEKTLVPFKGSILKDRKLRIEYLIDQLREKVPDDIINRIKKEQLTSNTHLLYIPLNREERRQVRREKGPEPQTLHNLSIIKNLDGLTIRTQIVPIDHVLKVTYQDGNYAIIGRADGNEWERGFLSVFSGKERRDKILSLESLQQQLKQKLGTQPIIDRLESHKLERGTQLFRIKLTEEEEDALN